MKARVNANVGWGRTSLDHVADSSINKPKLGRVVVPLAQTLKIDIVCVFSTIQRRKNQNGWVYVASHVLDLNEAP